MKFECKTQYDLADFIALIDFLRSENGCPWDRVQTHESMRRNLLEEACELAETIDQGDTDHMEEELGDVLMQVLFHTSIEAQDGHFTLDDVADRACKKLVSRHPNVFGEKTDRDWDQLKREERGEKTVASTMDSVARTLPALWRAEKIQKKAARVGFDWPDVQDALEKVEEEIRELREGIESDDRDNMMEEVGDLIFAAVDVARMCGIDPEEAVHRTCEKSIRRMTYVEQAAARDGKRMEELTLSQMEAYHQKARQELEGKTPVYEKLEYFQSLEEK